MDDLRLFSKAVVKTLGFPAGWMVKNPPANAGDAGDPGLIPGSGRSPGGGNDNSLQYSCLENSTDRGAWWATVHRVGKSQTWLSTPTHIHSQNMSVSSVMPVKILNSTAVFRY